MVLLDVTLSLPLPAFCGSTFRFYTKLKKDYNTYLTVPDPYWMSGGTNKEPMGYTDGWNHIPTDAAGTHEVRPHKSEGTRLHKQAGCCLLCVYLRREIACDAVPDDGSYVPL